MACIAGRLRAARCAAIAAEGPSASTACSLFQPASTEFFPSWFGLPWTSAARPIVTSSATSDAPSSSTGGDGRRPDNTSRRRQRPSDRDRADGSAQGPGADAGAPQPRGSARRDGPFNPRGVPGDRGDSRPPRGGGGGAPSGQRNRWDRGPATAASRFDGAAAPPPPPGGSVSPSSSSTSSSSLPLLRSPPPQQQPQGQQRGDLAARNAPQRVLQLIGDPRSGVADDTTANPFGEVTVDMVHYQPSNEVYWFKYEFTGNQIHGSHRDARLSDYTRNLMYLMRAKDPKRWTIQALADKFRIRKQRVLAILALKELEAQRMEDGRLMSGPLSAYKLTVRTDDVILDPLTGNPRLTPVPSRPATAAAAPPPQPDAEASEQPPPSSAPAATALAAPTESFDDQIDVVLPRVVAAAQKLQLRLVQLLSEYDYDSELVRKAFLADLDHAAGEVARVLGGSDNGGDGGSAGGGGGAYLQEELQSYRTAIEAVVAAVEEVVAGSPLLLEERSAAALRRSVEATLAAAGEGVLREAEADEGGQE